MPASPNQSNLALSPNNLDKVKLSAVSTGLALPQQDDSSLRRLAITAMWQNNILNSPVHIARKCPVLPGFIPRSMGHGLTVPTRDDASFDDEAPFHGSSSPKTNSGNDSSPKMCPYHHSE